MHWLVGTAFMFNFSVFVSLCREVVRPGVMWFIRDPNDEGFHPVREILERPVLVQLRKLGTGALMYFTLIILGVSMTTHGVRLLIKGVFPLRWPVDEPISDLPIDLLLFHVVVPFTLEWINPAGTMGALFVLWWQKLAHWMRLSSFMYGKDGERYPEEEGYFVYRSWKAWILRWRPPIPPIPGTETEHGNDTINASSVGSGEELDIDAPVIFVHDGGLYRVPNTDRVVYLKNRRVLVPVDATGRALDPKEDLPGEIDPLMEIQPRGHEPRESIDPKDDTVIVYAPPNFKQRLITFIVLIWTTTTAFLALSIVFAHKQVHDVYSFTLGVYVIQGILSLQSSLLAFIRTSGGSAQLRKILTLVKRVVKLIYFGLALGFIMPLVIGLLMDLFVLLPIRRWIGDKGELIPALSWAFGLIHMKILYHAVSRSPNLVLTRDIHRVFVSADPARWKAMYATERFIIPYLVASAVAVGLPSLVARMICKVMGVEGEARNTVFRMAYPVMLWVAMTLFALNESVLLLKKWRQYVRDQEYLVGRQLHNLTEEEENAAERPVEEESQDQEEQPRGPQLRPQHAAPQPQAQPRPAQAERILRDDNGGDRALYESMKQAYDEYVDVKRDEDDGMPELEPANSYYQEEIQGMRFGRSGSGSGSSSNARGTSLAQRSDHDYPKSYGRLADVLDEEEGDEARTRRSFGPEEAETEMDEYGEAEGGDTIAGRTRFRRSQRLQAIRGSQDDH
ncbi:hypothetical protein EDD11_005359 [Mortierella claussenii]|nr:hypothetical protein EDD11_005359 [Mortierella claussenii]